MKLNDNFIDIEIKDLIEWHEPNGNGCIVSDKITKEGFKVGYMYREQPDDGRPDSGWRFMAGNEDEDIENAPVHVSDNGLSYRYVNGKYYIYSIISSSKDNSYLNINYKDNVELYLKEIENHLSFDFIKK